MEDALLRMCYRLLDPPVPSSGIYGDVANGYKGHLEIIVGYCKVIRRGTVGDLSIEYSHKKSPGQTEILCKQGLTILV